MWLGSLVLAPGTGFAITVDPSDLQEVGSPWDESADEAFCLGGATIAGRSVIYAFEGPFELYAHESPTAAEGFFEAVDIQHHEYVFFADDGTVVEAKVRGGAVVLARSDERRPSELRDRLRTYLTHPSVALNPALAEDPPALGRLLLGQQRRRH